MRNSHGLSQAAALVLLAAAPSLSFAVETHVWEQNEQADFGRGRPEHVSIRSDGHVTLSPSFHELDSTGVPYLWAIAQDSKGTLYYAGGAPTGATAKVFSLAPKGKSKVFAELTGLEVHALAIDSRDRVYAAVMPDAKIYRLDGTGKPELFFDPQCKYVWSMLFDHSGNLFVTTGEDGIIYRIAPDGKGAVFYRTEETHARSLALDDEGNLIVGTEPDGLVLRITPKAQSFVLYQTNKREVTSVAVHGAMIYAASVGNKPAGSITVTGPAPILPAPTPQATSIGSLKITPAAPVTAPAVGSLSASISGGSELYRIQRDGFAEKIWNSSTDLIYALAFDPSGRVLVGTGNKGYIYRIDSDQLSTQLLNAPPTQVTAFLQGRNDVVYAATGNVGNIYAIGPSSEDRGTIESEVLDASSFARWGKIHLVSNLHTTGIAIETRSGNVSRAQSDWSPWTKVKLGELGGQVQSPPARFLQYRLTLTCGPDSESPELSSVQIAYLARNIAPKINQIEIAPFNYRQPATTSLLERSLQPSGSPTTLTLPAVGQKKSPSTLTLEGSGSATLQYSKGYMTVRWNASDDDGDSMLFKVEIRGKNDKVWRTLKDNLQDRFCSFDSASLPDGEYVLRITATDAPSNTPTDALTSSLETDPFTIDNTPPEIIAGVHEATGSSRLIKFTAKDALSWIDKAEYSIDGGEWTLLEPVNHVTDSQTLQYELRCKIGQLVAVRVFDEADNAAVKQF